MKALTDIGLLFRRHLVQLLRSPVWLVVGFSTPILYLALFTPLLKHLVGCGRPARRQRARPVPAGHPGPARVRQRQRPGLQHDLRAAGRGHRAAPGHPGQPVRDPGRPDPGLHAAHVRASTRWSWPSGPPSASMCTAAGLIAPLCRARAADGHDGGLLHRHRPGDQGHQRLRRHHQRPEPAGAAARRGAAAHLARAGLDAGPGPPQPALLRGHRRPGPGGRHA